MESESTYAVVLNWWFNGKSGNRVDSLFPNIHGSIPLRNR